MIGDFVNTAPMYPLHENSVMEAYGMAGLSGDCYSWTQPCGGSGETDPCTESKQAPTVCAPTVTWFWIGVAGVVAFALLKGGKK